MRTFATRDKWDSRDAPNRRVKRLVDKENKKARDAARKEYTLSVRQLAAFVHKRDKRGSAADSSTALHKCVSF